MEQTVAKTPFLILFLGCFIDDNIKIGSIRISQIKIATKNNTMLETLIMVLLNIVYEELII